ncbi:MAG: hypothetical protein KDE47_11215 [Caldilineaceae bacterium]|nr:hypothetical protein [Caldilineaceae bacterium]
MNTNILRFDYSNMTQEEINEWRGKHFASPKRIYLQDNGGGDTTWCEDRINAFDVVYVRLDLVNDLLYEFEKEKLFRALALEGKEGAQELLEQTRRFDEHPEWYENFCLCQLCLSYA